MQKAATPKSNGLILHTDESKAKRPPFKIEETVSCLLKFGPSGLTQPEANGIYKESCLNTVVSYLHNECGIQINRKLEPAHNKHRRPFNRYWLADSKAEVLAVCLLNNLRFKRGMAPIVPGDYSNLTNQAA
jgi:hypothetical protein